MKHVALILSLLFIAAVASAEPVVLTWENPTLYEDGTAIAPGTPGLTRIYIGDTASGPWSRYPDSSMTLDWPISEYAFTAEPGRWYTATSVVWDGTDPASKVASSFAVPAYHDYPPVIEPVPEPEPVPPKKPHPPRNLKLYR